MTFDELQQAYHAGDISVHYYVAGVVQCLNRSNIDVILRSVPAEVRNRVVKLGAVSDPDQLLIFGGEARPSADLLQVIREWTAENVDANGRLIEH